MRSPLALGLVLSLAGGLAACSGGQDGAAASPPTQPAAAAPAAAPSAGGRPPEFRGAEIGPARPVKGDTLRIAARVVDPERAPVSVTADWYRNRKLVREGGPLELATDELRRGDEIYAVVRASDGDQESIFQTAVVWLQNAPPVVKAVRVLPRQPTASDTLMAEATVEDRDGDVYDLHFAWFVNGRPVEGSDGPTLDPGRARRGDKVALEVHASDTDVGPVYRSEVFAMANARPVIDSKPRTDLAGPTRYEYQIEASDPDADRPLRYWLVKGPDEMNVDLVSGLVEWTIPPTAEGRFPIEVGVRDPYGGEVHQSYELVLSWEAGPANAGDAESERDEP